MTVAWNTDGDVGSEVEYGLGPGKYTEKATGKSFKGIRKEVLEPSGHTRGVVGFSTLVHEIIGPPQA